MPTCGSTSDGINLEGRDGPKDGYITPMTAGTLGTIDTLTGGRVVVVVQESTDTTGAMGIGKTAEGNLF